MIKTEVKTRMDVQKVLRKAKRANIQSLGQAGAFIRTTARRSIRKRKKIGPVGKPPRTKNGRLRKSILFAVEKKRERVLIGPSHKMVGRSGAAHEHGIKFKGDRFEKRPYMGPALIKVAPKLPRKWSGSIR